MAVQNHLEGGNRHEPLISVEVTQDEDGSWQLKTACLAGEEWRPVMEGAAVAGVASARGRRLEGLRVPGEHFVS